MMERYTYDGFNRLTKSVINEEETAYAYDGTGLRQAKTTNGLTTKHIYDGMNIVVDKTADEKQIFVRGINLIARTVNGGAKEYYSFNMHGDTTALSSSTGGLIKDYRYDAFGNQLQTLANDNNPFRYAGEYTDLSSGLIYLRNRYYDPSVGRFISEDPIKDGLNWYVYTSNNPVNRIDPMGTDDYTINQLTYLLNLKNNYVAQGVSVQATAAQGDIYRERIKQSPMMSKAYFASLVEEAFGDGSQGSTEQVKQLIYAGNANTALEKISADQDDTMTMEQHNWVHSSDAVHNFCAYQITVAEMQDVCFDGETVIVTNDGNKKIKDIEIGDYVYSKNEQTGEQGLKKVVNVFENQSNAILHIKIDEVIIKTTPTHPFWVDGKGWISAFEIVDGDLFVTKDGIKKVARIIRRELFEEPQIVYNFEVEDWHTYFVSDLEVWVHNACEAGNSFVYFGVNSAGANVYVGITNDISRRQGEHGDRFRLIPITGAIPRMSAKAIEQGMIEKYPQFENKINSISPKNPVYGASQLEFEEWEKENGYR